MYLGKERVAEDLVQAYLWFDLAAGSYDSRTGQGADFSQQRDEAIRMRKKARRKMRHGQRNEAERLVREWLEAHPE